MTQGERRLAAIMYTDMVGYTALGQRNEALSLALVEEQRKLIRPILSRHNGREIKTIGDAFLVEFPNALDAVRCAYEIQRATKEYNISLPSESRIHLRIGLHLGDVVESHGDISGDAVNVASRIEPLSEDGGVCVTRPVYDSMHNKLDVQFVSIGMKSLKNVSEPMEVYKMEMPWAKLVLVEMTALPTSRIAILPFSNMSPDPNDEYFADGITEEIISTVSGISGLEVISRTSVMGYKSTTKRVEDIGRELKVGSVLEGSFRKAGNRIRVTTQLIEVARDRHLWAQSYDRNLDDIFEVQSDVAKQVAEALRVRILLPEKERIEKRPTESTAAYTFYLKGRQLWNRRGLNNVKEALTYFERAVKEDPNFALGYVGQADCYIVARPFLVPPVETREKLRVLASKALALDPELAEAHTTNGGFLADFDFNLQEGEKEFRKAIELKPSYATAHQWYETLVLIPELRWDEALLHGERAVELDPLSAIINYNHGEYYYYRRDYPRAIESHERAVELGFTIAHFILAWEHGWMKEFDEMKREYAAHVELTKDSEPLAQLGAGLWMAYFMDDKETVNRLLPELETHFADEWGPSAYHIAALHLSLGEQDKAFEWLERSYSKAWLEPIVFIKADPFFDGIRNDPRYLDLLKRLGLDQTLSRERDSNP